MSAANPPKKSAAWLVVLLSLVSLGALGVYAVTIIQERRAASEEDQADDPVRSIRAQLAEAQRLKDLWIAAEKAGDEGQRKAYIIKTRDACNAVIDKVDRLRTPPYIDPKSEEFRTEYIYIEDMAQSAGKTLFEITRRSRLGDF